MGNLIFSLKKTYPFVFGPEENISNAGYGFETIGLSPSIFIIIIIIIIIYGNDFEKKGNFS
jgi:hypothetical protein